MKSFREKSLPSSENVHFFCQTEECPKPQYFDSEIPVLWFMGGVVQMPHAPMLEAPTRLHPP